MSRENDGEGSARPWRDLEERVIDLALAGLQQPVYACVLHRQPPRETWIGEVPFDRYRRRLRVTMTRRPPRAGGHGVVYRIRLSGLHLAARARTLDLERMEASGRPALAGRLDLGAMALAITVLETETGTGRAPCRLPPRRSS
ncbi:hypothetical protein DRV85_07820 [Rhodosalinus halophilus]|uniref:Uncharacterized protein n=1 Tax=Rhodosalinus halophilus TaxID=2259333 RepID=A0A365U9I2_9RHOB|nr:hypothetical protein [Rhodosalinus halophilus]RBI85629.1 hypothetical protein DRV85_07820 [Rhodosalinus halophilus]